MREYTRLADFITRCGKILHYMVCHQVLPVPNFDSTSLFFKIGEMMLRLSRIEYALVSDLKFGLINFETTRTRVLPPNSVYERFFGTNNATEVCDVRTTNTKIEFVVNKKKVNASKDDIVELSKLLACGFDMGYETTKKKIPQWTWVFLEDDNEWEAFP